MKAGMRVEPLTIFRDVLSAAWAVSLLVSLFLGQDIPSFVLQSFLGVTFLLDASARRDDGKEKSRESIWWDRFLGALMIVCSVVPLAVMAYRNGL